MSEFSMFYKVFGCIHACILHVLSVRLTRVGTNASCERIGKKRKRSLRNNTCVRNCNYETLGECKDPNSFSAEGALRDERKTEEI